MRFVWTPRNQEKVERHGLTRALVEAVFSAEDFRISAAPTAAKWTGEGTVDGKLYRVAFSRSGPREAYIITAYQVSRKRRST